MATLFHGSLGTSFDIKGLLGGFFCLDLQVWQIRTSRLISSDIPGQYSDGFSCSLKAARDAQVSTVNLFQYSFALCLWYDYPFA